jgi:hypothetical protein
MRRVFVVVVVVLSLGASGWMISHYDESAASREPETADTSTTVAGGEALVVVPTELGRNGFVAGIHLKLTGLEVVTLRTPSVSIPKNFVISQSPEQGTEVPEGTVIELTLSSGPP